MESTTNLEDAMVEKGLDPKGIIADGAVHRFSVDGDRRGQQSGAYCSNGNGFGNELRGHIIEQVQPFVEALCESVEKKFYIVVRAGRRTPRAG